MKTRTLLSIIAVLFAAFTLPTQTFAQSTNVKTRNTNQSTKFKSVIVNGSGNRIQSNLVTSFIGAGQSNTIFVGSSYAVLGGGFSNSVSGEYAFVGAGKNNSAGTLAFVGGGISNSASQNSSVVCGGSANQAYGYAATVGGGEGNEAAAAATVGGGRTNRANNYYATVGGGVSNTAGGQYATVPGGLNNTASGEYSFAAGRRAKANDAGSFVWADSTDADFASSGTNQFLIRAKFVGINRSSALSAAEVFGIQAPQTSGFGGMYIQTSGVAAKPFYGYSVSGNADAWTYVDGNDANKWKLDVNGVRVTVTTTGRVGIGTTAPTEILQVGTATCNGSSWVNSSDRNLKTSFRPVDGGEILRKVAALPISEWTYKASANGSRHVGPTAQDFREIFGLGDNDKTISTIDPSGVALAAIQGLIEELKQRDKKIEELEAKSTEIADLKSELRALREHMQSSLPPAP